MQFESDKNTQHKMTSGYIFHIMQYEMNVANRFTTNHRGLDSRQDPKNKRKKEKKWSGTGTCDNIASDLMTTHPSKVFTLLAELIAV